MNDEINIFLAEDDHDDSFLFQEALNKLPYNTTLFVAHDGEVFTEMLNKLPAPDFIFLDLNMPKKDGYVCLNDIRTSAKLDHVPVIIMSTSSNEQSITRAHSEGANLYIRKPDNFAGLVKIIGICIEKKNKYPDKPPKEDFFLAV